MEFTLICPRDGQIELGMEDISAVVFHGPTSCDIVFICPHCGTALRATVEAPALFQVAMEIARLGEAEARIDLVLDESADDGRPETGDAAVPERVVDAYCEYFRRQLSRVTCVEDLLAEIDAG
ncbi:MAG: hypothetical protein QMD76_08150 [Anaerosomatales bacterium]|nr:hypothetical protein [Anaerosomatales bacterium]